MQRRQLLKSAVALPLLGALAPLASARVMSPFQRLRPSDPYWPSAAEWQSLKSALGGNLLEVPPLLAACAGAGEDPACAEVLQNIRNPFYLGDQPGELKVEFLGPNRGFNVDYYAEMMNDSPYTIPGVSDGGAHTKFFNGGAYTTDFLRWLVRDEQRITLEEAHYRLSALPAHAAGFRDRGTLREGQAADVVPMTMCQDHVFDRRLTNGAERGHRVARARLGRARVDRHDRVAPDDERQVAEVVPFGHVHAFCLTHQPFLAEAESVLRVETAGA